MKLIATDLDRTLIPNGTAHDDNSVVNFTNAINQIDAQLIYVTARNIDSVSRAIERYSLPLPDAVIGQVGSSMHRRTGTHFEQIAEWNDEIQRRALRWDRSSLVKSLANFPNLNLQASQEQNQFKLSYQFDSLEPFHIEIPKIVSIVYSIAKDDAIVTASQDVNAHCVYVDIMPSAVTKRTALDFYNKIENNQKTDTLFAGDSENDLSVLLSDYPAVLVGNAVKSLKKEVRKNRSDSTIIIAPTEQTYGNGIVHALKRLNWL